MILKKSTAFNMPVLMVASSDHISGLTGATLTVTASKNGGAFAAITPTVTELATGWYSLALTTAHTDTSGALAIHVTAASADPADVLAQVVVLDPYTALTDASIASAVWASVVEGSTTMLQAMRGYASVLLGKASGLDTTTAVYRDLDDTKARITAQVDASGNRTVVTRDLT